MTRHIVNLPWVATTRDDVSATTGRMRESSENAVYLGSAPEVDSGSTGFMNKWDERRGDLGDYLQSVEDFLTAVHDGFNEASTSLRDATSEGGAA